MPQRKVWIVVAQLIPLALIAAALVDESWRIYSHHGLLHSSIVYAIFDRGVPPENPLMAGAPIGYPYGHHAALAFVMRWVPVAPPWLFAATNLIALGLLLALVDRTAVLLGGGARYRAVAALLTTFGTSPIARGPLAQGFKALGLNEGRTIPLLKFSTVNSNQLGILLFVFALYALVRALVAKRIDGPTSLMLGLAWVGSGLLYPTTWPAVVGLTGATLLVMAFHSRVRTRELALRLVVPCLVASAIVIPWILFVSAGRNSVSFPQLNLTPAHLLRNVTITLGTAVIPLALLGWNQRRTALSWDAAHRMLALSAGGLGVFFIFFHLPIDSEYKYSLLSQIPLAFLMAGATVRVLESRPWLLGVLLAFLIVPGGSWLVMKVVAPRAVRDAATTNGRSLQHEHPHQRALNEWIAGETPLNAVLVDTHLSIPAFARRSLYVGTDERRRLEPMARTGDGIDGSPQRWVVDVHGADLRDYERRTRIVRALLWKEGSEKTREIGAAIAAELPGRPIYVVARDPDARARLARSDGFRSVFENPVAGVYRYGEAR